MKTPGKWIEGVEPATPIAEAAEHILRARIDAVNTLLPLAAKHGAGRGGGGKDRAEKIVHELRVATRRASSALGIFEPWLDSEGAEKMRKRLSRIRRAAGAARDCDVHRRLVEDLRDHAPDSQRRGIEHLARVLDDERGEAHEGVVQVAVRYGGGCLRRARRKLLGSLSAEESAARGGPSDEARPIAPVPATAPLCLAAKAALGEVLAGVRAAAGEDLNDIEKLHEFRITIKRLRYAAEVLEPCLDHGFRDDLYPLFGELQERLGNVNDTDTVLRRIEREIAELDRAATAVGIERDGAGTGAGEVRASLTALKERFRRLRDRRCEEFMRWWREFDLEGTITHLEGSVVMEGCPTRDELVTSEHTGHASDIEPKGAANGFAAASEPSRHEIASHANGHRRGATGDGLRLGAIDLGTNSIRLVIAEVRPDRSYRVLDDEKEFARLGRGLVLTGRLEPGAMEQAVAAVGRMRNIAEGYGAGLIRVIGTAAVREAANGAEFAGLVRQRTGLDLEIITAEEEARLAHVSVANAFGDLRSLNAAILDTGGGSTQLILCSRGVIEEVYTLPLGAVRMMDQFGGPGRCAGAAYRAMRAWIRQTLDEHVGEPPFAPELVIGTGGTVTTLAAIAAFRSSVPERGGLMPGSVQGYQLKRSEVRDILDLLRPMPLEDRPGVRGLSADRADIIVPGIVIVESVMKHLGVRRLRVHERGIRDGLLLTMIGDLFPLEGGEDDAPGDRNRLVAARRFAETCRYEERHSEHVAGLALGIFDEVACQLATERSAWASPLGRELLEAAGVLHDVGYIINYAKHHKHSYHLIVHADLPGFSAPEVEVVANLARYHRRSGPKEKHPNFAQLAGPGRELVRALGAILRIADGLDRTHTQNVRAVQVRIEGNVARFIIQSSDDPTTDLWGAARKAGLFQKVFGLEPRFEWTGTEAATPDEGEPAHHGQSDLLDAVP